MNANAASLLSIFEKKLRLEVPLFQRQYVWNREQQWEPLWEDISRKFDEYLAGRKDAPVHFLGAMVLDQKQTPTTHVERRQVIDGQQRLTTLQIFLAAFRDFCFSAGCEELGREIESFTLNKGMMSEPLVDRFKVWPTISDRAQFSDVITSGSREALLARYPLTRQKYARQDDPRPKMVDAYLFFYDRLVDFFPDNDADEAASGSPLEPDLPPLSQRVEECFQALKNALQVVAIDLDQDDDAQVIFETLNARGEPLLPADLLRNYIFLRAARLHEPQEALYSKYWVPFDEDFWREEIRQGRLSRPRSDLFMQHFLASRQAVDVPIKHLFVEYKFWIERMHPFATVEEELRTLAEQRAHFRRLIQSDENDPLFRLSTFLSAFDVSTVYPLVLWFMVSERSDEELIQLTNLLESYIIRRAICNRTAKNYNRLFLRIIASMQRNELHDVADIANYLGGLTGESGGWPSNDAFAQAWQSTNVYANLRPARVSYILQRLGETYYGTKMERIKVDSQLTVEHLMPQDWRENWPLPDGSVGLDWRELWDADRADARAVATNQRNELIHTMGNLTILTQPLNSAVSNGTWSKKKPALLSSSLLPLNQQLHSYDIWDEQAIATRSEELLSRAIELWPRIERTVSDPAVVLS